ncbi:MAG: ATP synthase F1 subunit epsilon [Candidatus Kerfeldbacteria bacterium]|nr:ATP synthase F1 subunit epsilon [Candidatus Kerfeldbacteria bacterium]
MSTRLHLQLVTPTGTLMDREVDSVTLPTRVGEITILPDHAPLVSVLSAGEATIADGSSKTPFVVAGGVVEVFQNTVAVLADTAEEPTAIDVKAAEENAKKLAAKIAAEPVMDSAVYAALLNDLDRERAKINIGKKWQKIQ